MLFLSLTVTSIPQRCRSDNAAVITAVSILARLHRSGRAAVATGCYANAFVLLCVASLVVADERSKYSNSNVLRSQECGRRFFLLRII